VGGMANAPSQSPLFRPYHSGGLSLGNRIVMAPMTRSRAIGNVPQDITATYYGERATAGLIVTEGTAPTPDGLGYARIPGIFSGEQVKGWTKVADAVHKKGGKIFMQLMHTGRITHPLNQPAGARVLAPSAVRAEEKMYTDAEGPKDLPEPEAMSLDDIRAAVKGYTDAAKNAMSAGFDGIELHSANGYLLEQFLNPHTNRRTDEYGGSAEKRNRFVLEVARSVVDAIGPSHVGIRVSPYSTFNDMRAFDETEAQYSALARQLGELGLAYLHVVVTQDERARGTARVLKKSFSGTLILAQGFDRASAEAAINKGEADLVAFGRPFLANPDLVQRLETSAPLAEPDFSKLYTPGPEGYLGYPSLAE
jgi:N-ethylmaleimide reductase